jgi:hypothetical protein
VLPKEHRKVISLGFRQQKCSNNRKCKQYFTLKMHTQIKQLKKLFFKVPEESQRGNLACIFGGKNAAIIASVNNALP